MYIDGLATKIAIKSRLRVAACHRHVETPDLFLNQVIVCSVDVSRQILSFLRYSQLIHRHCSVTSLEGSGQFHIFPPSW